MAPMTRNMANDDLSPTEEMAHYYARRAAVGLIITEGTIVAPEGRGYSHTPGIYTQQQIDRWKKVTSLVHENGGHIFLQLWHVGRVSHPDFISGKLPLSASETYMQGQLSRSNLSYGPSRAATDKEIEEVINQFEKAAKNAILAGFDGVEIHGANGYLIDQFLHYDTNHRIDQFGGTADNMSRFPLAVVKACGNAIGYERVGIRLSPGTYLHQITGDARDADTFSYLLNELSKTSIAYVHTGNIDDATRFTYLQDLTMTAFIRTHYNGIVIAAGNYTADTAAVGLQNGEFDLVSIGRPLIANPDLIEKLQKNKLITPFHQDMLASLN